MIENIQNKICSFNIIMNDVPITKTPILFKIDETGNKGIEDIIHEHCEPILNKIYETTNDLDELTNSKIFGIVYDIVKKEDIYETYEIDINKYLDYDDNRFENILINKINYYTDLVLNKIGLNVHPGNKFTNGYNKISEANKNKISKETFIQYILSCFNKEYGSKYNETAERIMNKEFNND